MKKLTKILSLVLAVVLVATLFAGCSSNKEEKVLKMGLDPTFAPMGFRDDDGNLVGFDIDVANKVVELLDDYDKIELVPIDWDYKIAELEAGNVDMIWNGFTMHVDNRDQEYEWTEAYMNNSQAIVVKEGSDIKTKADLAGKVIATQVDSSGLAAVNKDEEFKNSLAEILPVATYDDALRELEAGTVDAVVGDIILANYRIQNGSKGTVLEEKLSDEEYGVAFLKGNTELRDKVQAALYELAENGELAKISEKWFGKDITCVSK